MHVICLIIGLLVATAIVAKAEPRGDAKAAVSPIRTVDPADRTFDDLDAFGKAVGSARCVVLGEQTHGDGNVFSLKVRLVEYLHDKMGFDVLAMESGIYDGAKVEQAVSSGKAMKDEVGGSIFYMYSGTKQVAPLWDYIDSQRSSSATPPYPSPPGREITNPLQFVTIDSQLSGKKSQDSLCDDLEAQLRRRHSPIPDDAEWSTFKTLTLSVFQMHQTRPAADEQRAYFATLDAIDQTFAADKIQGVDFPDGSGFWRRVIAGWRVQARRYWVLGIDEMSGVNGRDVEMAGNLEWVLNTVYPRKKVIVWCHDGHGAKVCPYPGFKGMLQRVREVMPHRDFYHVFFTGYDGESLDFVTGKPSTV